MLPHHVRTLAHRVVWFIFVWSNNQCLRCGPSVRDNTGQALLARRPLHHLSPLDSLYLPCFPIVLRIWLTETGRLEIKDKRSPVMFTIESVTLVVASIKGVESVRDSTGHVLLARRVRLGLPKRTNGRTNIHFFGICV